MEENGGNPVNGAQGGIVDERENLGGGAEEQFGNEYRYNRFGQPPNHGNGERMTIKDAVNPNVVVMHHAIRPPPVETENFEIKPPLIHLIQNTVQFHGLPTEDPHEHLAQFLNVCNTVQIRGCHPDAILLRLFPFSLKERAKHWLNSLPPGCITTWRQLTDKFLTKYFPPSKTAKMRNDINAFQQLPDESFYDAWERLKELVRKVPHHGLSEALIIQTFYMGLTPTFRLALDSSAGGTLMNLTPDEAYDKIEAMATSCNSWEREKGHTQRKQMGVYELNKMEALEAQVATMANQLAMMRTTPNVHGHQVNAVDHSSATYGGMEDGKYPDFEQMCYLNNSDRNNNPFSNTYNPGWRNHPNFRWKQDQGNSSNFGNFNSNKFGSAAPPGFNQGQTYQQPQEKKSTSEELLNQLMRTQTQFMQSQIQENNNTRASIKNLEVQMGQIAQAVNARQPGSLPSDTQNNPKEDKGKIKEINAVTLRSGKKLPEKVAQEEEFCQEDSSQPQKEEIVQQRELAQKEEKSPSESKKEEEPKKKWENFVPPPPFPGRLKKKQQRDQFEKFMEVFKKLHINIPFAEALEQMPHWVKFMKDTLTRKRKFLDQETVQLTKECSAIIQKQLPEKMEDPGSFTIPCTIGNNFSGRALCDLGASINLMPFSVYQKLGLGECQPTSVLLQLADCSKRKPRGVIPDVLVKVDKFILPADFVILDMEEDREIPIIFGRPFLSTGKTIINVEKGELSMTIEGESIKFNVLKEMKYPTEDKECYKISDIKEISSINYMHENRNDPLKDAQMYKGKKKNWHNRHSDPQSFYPGHQVLRFNSRLKIFPVKLKSRWSGPFRVQRVFPSGAIKVKDERYGNTFMVNKQNLRIYHGSGIDHGSGTSAELTDLLSDA